MPKINFLQVTLDCQPIHYIGFEFLTATTMMSFIFWDVMPHSLVIVSWCFGESTTYLLHLKGQRLGQARSQHDACSKQNSTCFMLFSLTQKMEVTDSSEMLVDYSIYYIVLYPRRHNTSIYYLASIMIPPVFQIL